MVTANEDSKVKGKQINSLVRLYNWPAIHSAVGLVLTGYLYVKAFNPLFTRGLDVAEKVADKNLKIASQLFESQSKFPLHVHRTRPDERKHFMRDSERTKIT